MLKQRALTATLWSGLDILLRQGLQFVVAIVLARLLSPTEFGTVATLAIFTGIAAVLMDGGLSAALIQRQDADHTDESTVFWFNLGIGLAIALALCASAPAIAAFFALPDLTPLTFAMALSVFVGGAGAIHTTLLSKRLEFRKLMKINASAALMSGCVAVTLALAGYGVWALAAQSVAMAVSTTLFLWLADAWRPALVFSRESARKLFGFGGYHLASSLLEALYSRLYTVLIGRLYGTRDLGLYSYAETTRQMPGSFMISVLARVALPMFSAAAHDRATLRRGMQLSIRGMMLLNAPIMLGIAALAEPAVRLLFGQQWSQAAPILRVLCLAGLFYPLHAINLHALMAQGHSNLMFKLEATKKTLGLALIFCGAGFGVLGIAWSQVLFSLASTAINAWYSRRLLGYGLTEQMRDAGPVVIAAGAMAAVVFAVQLHWHPAPWLAILSLGLAGAMVFLVLAWTMGLHALHDVALLFPRGRVDAPAPRG
jgi:teichuronic acid exporter